MTIELSGVEISEPGLRQGDCRAARADPLGLDAVVQDVPQEGTASSTTTARPTTNRRITSRVSAFVGGSSHPSWKHLSQAFARFLHARWAAHRRLRNSDYCSAPDLHTMRFARRARAARRRQRSRNESTAARLAVRSTLEHYSLSSKSFVFDLASTSAVRSVVVGRLYLVGILLFASLLALAMRGCGRAAPGGIPLSRAADRTFSGQRPWQPR